MKKLLRLLSGLLVVAVAAPALAQVTDEDIDNARAEVNRITEQSAQLGQEVIDAYGRQLSLNSEIERLQSSIEFAKGRLTETQARLQDVAVELYMGSTSGTSLSVLFSAGDQEYPAGMEYLRQVNGDNVGVVTQMRTFRDELEHDTARLSEALEEQEEVTLELEEKAGELQSDLVAAQQVYDQLVDQQQREEEERRRREEERRRREAAAQAAAAAAATSTSQPSPGSDDSGESSNTTAPSTTPPPSPPSPGGGACPVAGAVSFTDSWGAPRSGGRSHKGVDMIAARGTPIVAIYSGKIQRFSNSSLGGKSIYFTSDAGDLYYYAHLDDFADVGTGQQVEAGTVIGYNGSSGNAPDYLPHLHFEYHPGGGSAVNPYPLVRSIC
ncbi:MAG TPA: peptidoglycan DD-metalloendopeptidase family protein [Acidimicrobiia bacterium]